MEQDPPQPTITLKRKVLSEVIFQSKYKALDRKFVELESFLMSKTHCSEKNKADLLKKIAPFKHEFKYKWLNSGRHKERFLVKESKWLEGSYSFDTFKSIPGSPFKDFSLCSDSSKRRRTQAIRKEHSAEELIFAGQSNLRKYSVALIKRTMTTSQSSLEMNESQDKLSSTAALSMIIEAKLSKSQYEVIRGFFPNLLPSYKLILKEKKRSYPCDVNVTETEASVYIQKLLDHTAERLVDHQKEVIISLDNYTNATLISKWGFDGSSGHSQYMQKFVNSNDDDKFVFLSCLVPIQLYTELNGNKVIIWQNLQPASPRFCRPIRLLLKQESNELIRSEKEYIEQQILRLENTKIKIDNHFFMVKHMLLFTMVDGKICNSLSEIKSSMRCYLCNFTSKDFNNIDLVVTKPLKQEYISFGISLLHAWIRFFENLLHIAYRLPFKEWRITKQLEPVANKRKSEIQEEFKTQIGLIIDKPKPGYGNTNVGNNARKIFQNADVSSRITGIDESLIKRFHIVLQTMASGLAINIKKFKIFCFETAQLYVHLYPWYNMCTTVHKVLMHGHIIIKEALLPIGILSEEALESRNKDFKRYRESFSRKTSRKDTLQDIFNMMLISSDPAITLLRCHTPRKRKNLDKQALFLLEDNIFQDCPTVRRVLFRGRWFLHAPVIHLPEEENEARIDD